MDSAHPTARTAPKEDDRSSTTARSPGWWRVWSERLLSLLVKPTKNNDDHLDDSPILPQAALEHASPSRWRTMLKFIGPGYMVAVGYMDPGNWATDIGGGARFGYTLLSVILLSSLAAMVLQVLCIKLGVVTGRDLAQQCRHVLPRYANLFLYLLAEIAIMATDLAEVIGSAIALNLLFGLPLPWGVLITGFDVLIILRWWGTDRKSTRVYELIVLTLVLVVATCFIIQLVFVKPDGMGILRGFLPSLEIFRNPKMMYMAIGILGATVMPHNLYLHSSIVKGRRIVPGGAVQEQSVNSRTQHLAETMQSKWPQRDPSPSPGHASVPLMEVTIRRADASPSTSPTISPRSASPENQPTIITDRPSLESNPSSELPPPVPVSRIQDTFESLKSTIFYASIDCMVALTIAMAINSTILIVGAAAFWQYGHYEVEELQDAYRSLETFVGHGTGTIFALALLASGQSSTLTGTMAGQIVMEGYLGMKMRPALRRLLTRIIAILPALVVAISVGESGVNELLLLSQVILSVTLPFAIIPLVYFTSSLRHMALPANKPSAPMAFEHPRVSTTERNEGPPVQEQQQQQPLRNRSNTEDTDNALLLMNGDQQLANGWALTIVSWTIVGIITLLNLYLVISFLFVH